METRADGQQGSRLSLFLLLAIVLLIRIAFCTQAIQGDDPYYIFGAQHALIDPAHPSHARYTFQGEIVDMRGHPHPPLNSWILAALIAMFGDVYEVPFHLVYAVFSVIAVWAMWSLASRWSPHPFMTTLAFIAVPAFTVNGNSLESDIPFVAWWLAGIALFTSKRYALAAVTLTLAAMTACQAVVVVPILWVWCWLHERRSRRAWIVATTPVFVILVYQVYERVTSGALPATVLAGYFSSYGLQQLSNKLRNAAALTAHMGWLLFPAAALLAFRRRWAVFVVFCLAGALIDPHLLFWFSFGTGALVIAASVSKEPDFLQAWVLIFFAASLTLFFAGSARYLLPLAAPVLILAARNLPRPALAVSAACSLLLGLSLAWVNWQHWDAYRRLVAELPFTNRTWINGELGMRFYAESRGALPVLRNQPVQAGDWLLSSELGFPLPVTAPLSLVLERVIRPTLPLRLIGLNSKSGYSTASMGLRPFDITSYPVDRIRAHVVRQRQPVLSWLPMDVPQADEHILSGVYQLEGKTRWMSGRAVLGLAPPDAPTPVEVQLFLPPQATAREVRVLVDGQLVHTQALPAPNMYNIRTEPARGSSIVIELDRTFQVAGDNRQLGGVLVAAGFAAAAK